MTVVTAIEVRRLDTNEVVHTVPLSTPLDPDSRKLERIMGGLLRNMSEDYYIAEVEEER